MNHKFLPATFITTAFTLIPSVARADTNSSYPIQAKDYDLRIDTIAVMFLCTGNL